MVSPRKEFRQALVSQASKFGLDLQDDDLEFLSHYYALLSKWNERLHLLAPCSPSEFAIRHVLESLLLLAHLPLGAKVIDIGSGGGLPIIPCLLIRGDLHATLIESSRKKSVFLREALRLVRNADSVQLIADRFENVVPPPGDFVTCRALDKFSNHLPTLIKWAPSGATFLLFTGKSLANQIKSLLPRVHLELIPLSKERFLVVAKRG